MLRCSSCIQRPHDIHHHQGRRREGRGVVNDDLHIGNYRYSARTSYLRVQYSIGYEYRDEEDHETGAGETDLADAF